MRAGGVVGGDGAGAATPYAMFSLQERGTLFIEPGTEVYEGMIVGENSRSDDMDVNIAREKKLTNMRQSTSDELERLVPPPAPIPQPVLGVSSARHLAQVT